MNNQPSIIKYGSVPPPWNSINFLIELSRSVSSLCKLTETPHLKVFAKVSQPVTFASDRLLVRVMIDNIVFSAIHDTKNREVPLLDIEIWLDEMFAHLEVKKKMPKEIGGREKSTLAGYFFRSFVYERRYNFGLTPVENAINALQGKMEVRHEGSELLLSIHIPNRADFGSASSSSQVSFSPHPSKYNQ